ncbi:dynein regulatory complex protein 11 [Calypte anna]|uniref:dynein regulatory complex protein 11 n=1 Tax=Calypte anna TaxID=9244 RepID=UPI0011C48658|nr:dynein regulatory complex protein 11 [Calypte anna]
MSQVSHNKMWRDAMKDLDILLWREKEEFLQPEVNPMKVFEILATSYIKYMQICRKLVMAQDHLVCQQKQTVIRQVLDGVIGRILEIKKEMVELEKSEFQHMDNILVELQLLPEDLEVPIPTYFIKDNLEVLQQRERILDEILLNDELETQEILTAITSEEPVTVTEVEEKPQQDRRPAAFMKQAYSAKWKESDLPRIINAATCIQKVWRGYVQRKKTKKIREEEMIFLGMYPTPPLKATSIPQIPAGQSNELQGEVQTGEEKVPIKDKLREMERVSMKKTLQDQVGQCFIECWHVIGRFPDYPNEKAGGSMALFTDKTPEQVSAELAALQEKAMQKKDAGKEKQKEKAPQKNGKKGNLSEEEGWKMAPSNFLSIMEEGNSQYKVFLQNRDERWDFLQDHDPELIKEEKKEDVEEELREQVGELIQKKLENLRLAVDGEKTDKPKKGSKGQKGSKGKGKKKISQLEEDLTPDRTIDSLYEELAKEGLLMKAKTVNISDYVGDYSYLGSTSLQLRKESVPSATDVRQLIALYGILPLGSQTVHEKAPLVKALLLAGPAGVGKKMFVHAICTETGANLFNLSASNIAGKYPSKSELVMMLHMVLKVAKQLQPSVVWIGDTEKIFSKGVPKGDDRMNLKQLEKLLPDFLKALKAQDRVLIVGTTKRPFDANPKPFFKTYSKIIVIPRPDYGSRYVLWKHLILQNGGVITKLLKISSLAYVSDGFTQGSITQAVQDVLSELRLQQMPRQPLTTDEFVTSLGKQEPVYIEEEEAFKAWYAKTPLGRARLKALAGDKKAGRGKDLMLESSAAMMEIIKVIFNSYLQIPISEKRAKAIPEEIFQSRNGAEARVGGVLPESRPPRKMSSYGNVPRTSATNEGLGFFPHAQKPERRREWVSRSRTGVELPVAPCRRPHPAPPHPPSRSLPAPAARMGCKKLRAPHSHCCDGHPAAPVFSAHTSSLTSGMSN